MAFLDCLGCTAMGATVDEAIGFAIDALREWMSDLVAAGKALRHGRSAAEVREPGVLRSARDGSTLVSIAIHPPARLTRSASLRI